ncbi:MAG TPA: hypothetical protein VH760_01875 [Gaiellaceae bacterium]
MSVWGALAGGLVGTMVISIGLAFGQAVGWSRMDLPLLLGTVFDEDRNRARAIGWAAHFVLGLLFSLVYGAIFAAVGHAGWWFGLALGAVHAAFAGGPLPNLILPAVHPRMGRPWSDARDTPLLEPPGLMLANYGAGTAVLTTVLHLAYGAIVGGFAAGLS